MPGPSTTPRSPEAPTVITIGNFDGVHLGHQALLKACRARADRDGVRGRVIAAAFTQHPATILRDDYAPDPLTSFKDRADLLRQSGADDVIEIEPTEELLSMTPEAFLDEFFETHQPTTIVEGDDFRFGANRAGDTASLKALSESRNVEAIIVDEVDVGLTDQIVVRASSTITRWLLAQGRVADAAIVLGRPYRMSGVIVQGDRRGRQIGFPTANLDCMTLFPADAIYAGFATLDDGQIWPAAISVGTKPTFDGTHRVVEAYLCGWDGPAGPEYDWNCRLDCIAWIREQARFSSIASLVAQIERDVDHVLHCLDTLSAATPNIPQTMKAAT